MYGERYAEYDRFCVHDTLYRQALGELMLKAGRGAQEEEIARLAGHSAIEILEKIRSILNDESLNDRDCFLKIDSIVSVFHANAIATDRHIECD